MVDNTFFEEQEQHSRIKSIIVTKYFEAWSTVIIHVQKKNSSISQNIAYIDLFSGPGRYEDGSQSTPVLILINAIKEPDLRQRLITIFNDIDTTNSKTLEKVIADIPEIEKLNHKPGIHNQEVQEEIVKMFENMNLIPTLIFIDPWGYKGLSTRLLDSVLKDWGCDVIFFFNYDRINRGINIDGIRHHIDALFGKNGTNDLRQNIKGKNPRDREKIVLDKLCQAIKSYGSRYILSFKFKKEKTNRTSHFLVFISKNVLGYNIMKDIMAKQSSSFFEGIPSFEYNPHIASNNQIQIFESIYSLEALKTDLLKNYRGQTLEMKEIYNNHNVDTAYIKKNYKDVLRQLHNKKIIEAVSRKGKPPKGDTFGDNIIVTFPK